MKKSFIFTILLCMCVTVFGVEDTLDEIANVTITVQDDEILLNMELGQEMFKNISDPEERKKAIREHLPADIVWSE